MVASCAFRTQLPVEEAASLHNNQTFEYTATTVFQRERERDGDLPIIGGIGPPGGPMRGTGGGRIIPRGPDATGGGMATPL